MDNRKIACAAAAIFLGAALAVSATSAFARSPIEVIGRADPSLQRTVSYADLNLAFRSHRSVLHHRIYRTAANLCVDLNRFGEIDECTSEAVASTNAQVEAAIVQDKRQMAGLPAARATAISMAISAG